MSFYYSLYIGSHYRLQLNRLPLQHLLQVPFLRTACVGCFVANVTQARDIWKKEMSIEKKYPHHIGLWANLWGIFLD